MEVAPPGVPIKQTGEIPSLIQKWSTSEMALVLKGGEFIATEALSARVLAGLSDLARSRPLVVNGLEMHRQDLTKLAEEAQRTGKPVWPRLSCPTHFSLSAVLALSSLSGDPKPPRQTKVCRTETVCLKLFIAS